MKDKPLTEDYFYRARPRKNHPGIGWQSYCKECWKDVNRANKAKRKIATVAAKVLPTGRPTTRIPSLFYESYDFLFKVS